MRRARQWLLFLFPAVLFTEVLCAGSPRFARLAAMEGGVHVQIHAYEDWRNATPNVPLVEASRIRTDNASQVEIELDEGSMLRLVGDTLAEVSDYVQLSTAQRITLISLDHGTAYVSGRPGENDSLGVAVPGAQVLLRHSSKVRFVVSSGSVAIAILEGTVRFSTPTAEIELRHGQSVELNAANLSRFKLLREIPDLESDKWTNTRGAELEQAGHWMQTDDSGRVWKPNTADTWAPFQTGEWRWYEELGYTWIAAEPWGWKPYRSGRWLQHKSLGWVWVPGERGGFKPGEVYWMTGNNFIGWGPLAPGESWSGAGHPQQYAALNTTLSRSTTGTREIPASSDFAKPKDLLKVATFTTVLPSPPMVAARWEMVRAPLLSAGLSGGAKLISFAGDAVSVPGVSYTERQAPARKPPPAALPQQTPVRVERPVAIVIEVPVAVPVEVPVEIYYPYPVYTGFVVYNPPVKKKDPKNNTKPFPPYGGN